jgi:DNA polymerase III epsilon subunit-like protein
MTTARFCLKFVAKLKFMKGREFDSKTAPISFIDLEMTGLEAQKHEIVEVGLVKVSQPDLVIIEKWDIKVRPEHLETADLEALKISGYNEEKWKDAVSLSEMMKILAEKTQGSILAGFMVMSDYSFLDSAATKTGIPLDIHRRILDINSFAVAKMGVPFGENGLSSFLKILNISFENHHTALADAIASFELYKRVIREK